MPPTHKALALLCSTKLDIERVLPALPSRLLLSACVAYQPQALAPTGLAAARARRSLDAAAVAQWVNRIAPAVPWDGTHWDQIALLAAALDNSPAIAASRAALQTAQAKAAADMARTEQARSRIALEFGQGLATLGDASRARLIAAAGRAALLRIDIPGFIATARAAIARDVPLPAGVYLGYSGLAEGQAAAIRQLAINVAAAAAIAVAALLVLAFGGPRPALLIVAGTAFALTGGVIAAWLTGGVLSLGALVGFVMLFGIAARNAILLISHVDHLVEEEGEPFEPATVLRATRERVTPILMTALVTALGLAPLALEAGQSGREVQGPMAAGTLGGLVTSSLMCFALLPAPVLA